MNADNDSMDVLQLGSHDEALALARSNTQLPEWIRELIISSADITIITEFFKHQNFNISELVKALEKINPSFNSPNHDYIKNLLEELSLNPSQDFDLLWNSSLIAVQIWIANHPETSPEILNKMCGGCSRKTMPSVARNAKTPTDGLSNLALYPFIEVLEALLENPNTPDETKEEIRLKIEELEQARDVDPFGLNDKAYKPYEEYNQIKYVNLEHYQGMKSYNPYVRRTNL